MSLLHVPSRRVCVAASSCALSLLGAGSAWALGPEGSPIDTSDYTIDFYEGPNLQSTRQIGMAGATAALTPGVVGYSSNPATAAMRNPWSTDWFDWEPDFSVTGPAGITRVDFDNNGDTTFANEASLFINIGAGFQFGAFGAGLDANVSEYTVRPRDAGTPVDLTVQLSRTHLVLAHGFVRGQLFVGAGLGLFGLDLELADPTAQVPGNANVGGGSVLLGAAWAPVALPVTAGASARIALRSNGTVAPEGITPDDNGDYVQEGYYFPLEIVPPTEFQFAVATRLFGPTNLPWVVPPRRTATPVSNTERAARRAQNHSGSLLLSAALKLTLPVANGVGVESFLRQEVERSGEKAVYSPRLGLEGEPIANYLILRAGTYLEPTRFQSGSPRLHWTAGSDVHIPVKWSVFGLFDDDTTFRIGGAVDQAPRYFGWSATLGFWN